MACFFDLETKRSFNDVYPGYFSLPFDKREALREEVIPKMGLATACVIDAKGQATLIDEGREEDLIKLLNRYDVVVGHNVKRFDYLVLSGSVNPDFLAKCKSKTIDTIDPFLGATGRLVGLESLAICNGLAVRKTMKGEDAPALWRAGKKTEVRSYCEGDVRILKSVYELGKKEGKLKCNVGSKEIPDIRVVDVDW